MKLGKASEASISKYAGIPARGEGKGGRALAFGLAGSIRGAAWLRRHGVRLRPAEARPPATAPPPPHFHGRRGLAATVLRGTRRRVGACPACCPHPTGSAPRRSSCCRARPSSRRASRATKTRKSPCLSRHRGRTCESRLGAPPLVWGLRPRFGVHTPVVESTSWSGRGQMFHLRKMARAVPDVTRTCRVGVTVGWGGWSGGAGRGGGEGGATRGASGWTTAASANVGRSAEVVGARAPLG